MVAKTNDEKNIHEFWGKFGFSNIFLCHHDDVIDQPKARMNNKQQWSL